MKLIARALFCLKYPWAESVNDCTLWDAVLHRQRKEREMQLCISPHRIHESHKKDKVSAQAIDVTLLKRLSHQPPTQEPQEEAWYWQTCKGIQHCVHLMNVTTDKDITTIFVKWKSWINCHLKGQLHGLKSKSHYCMWSIPTVFMYV